MPQQEHEIRLQFLEEAQEYLNSIESGLLGLGINKVNRQQMDAVLRAAHSIKGGAGMMGFEALSHLAHRMEDFFKVIRAGKYGVADAELERLMLLGVDLVGQAINLTRQGVMVDETWQKTHAEPIFARLHQRLGDPQLEDAAVLSEDEGQDMRVLLFESEVGECIERLESILASEDMPCLLEEFQIAAQELGGLGEMLELPAFTSLCQSVEQYLETKPAPVEAIARLALAEWRRSRALIIVGQAEALPTKLDLVITVDSSPDLDTSALLDDVLSVTDDSVDAEELFPYTITPADELLTEVQGFRPAVHSEHLSSGIIGDNQENTIRVSAKQLEQLDDLFGELTIERNGLNLQLGRLRNLIATLSQRAKALEQSNFRLRTAYDKVTMQATVPEPKTGQRGAAKQVPSSSIVSAIKDLSFSSKFDILEMDRYSDLHLLSQEVMETIVQIQEVTSDIEINLEDTEHTARDLTRTSKQMQTNITQVRMRPFSDLVSRFPRVLRDLALEYGKNVELEVRGSAILIDRTVLEAIGNPLLHLLRNAFAHGIEEPALRRARGKAEQGVIEISAAYQGNQTVITISDDGGGIDLDKIRARAMLMGLDAAELAKASPNDLLELIFAPGFSTAEQVTDLSGRGVGMDIVTASLQQVRGEISLDTKPGRGTTFTITVPFTLSVVRILLVESQGMLLGFPIDAVEEMLLLQPEMVLQVAGKTALNWEGYMVPLIQLSQWLHFFHPPKVGDTEAVPTINQPTVLMVTQGDELVGLQVERFWGEQEVTIRQVEGSIAMPPGFSSCTILGDGRVVPLVDVPGLMRWIDVYGSKPHPLASSNPLVEVNLKHLPQATTDQTKTTVMVVDDSINVRRFLALTLEKAGYRVEQAKDGQDALEKFQAGLPIQTVVCDIEMPRLDGFGFLAQFKSNPGFKHIPVVMLTSRSGDKHRQLAMNLGATAYFSKPFREQELLQTLARLIESQLLTTV